MLKPLLIGAAFLLITGPGAVDAWLSLADRFSGNGEGSLTISVSAWYQAVFPIAGLLILMGIVWWTRNKPQPDRITPASTSNVIESVKVEPLNEDKHKTSKPVQKKEPKNSEITIETNNYPDTKLALIDASPSELMNICKEHTTAEAELLLAPFIGRLIVIKAKSA